MLLVKKSLEVAKLRKFVSVVVGFVVVALSTR
jgi:hypothetical protein